MIRVSADYEDRTGVHGSAIPSALPPRFRRSAGFLLSKAAQIVQTAFEAGLQEFAVTPRQFGVLQLVDLHGPQSQQRIGHVLGIDRTTMVALVDSLETSGMVVRVKDLGDRRRYAVSLTDRGNERLHTDLYAVDRQVADWFLEGISEPDCDHLLTLLEKVIEGRQADMFGKGHHAANDTDLSVRR